MRRCVTAVLFVALAFLAGRSSIAQEGNATKDAPPKKELPMPGEVFLVDGAPAFLIPGKPSAAKERTPWVWYAPTLPGLPSKSEAWMFERFTAAGISIAGIDVGESYGSPKGTAKYTELYKTLVDKRGMSRKPILLARSRGGLMLYSWACDNADKVGGIAGIYPVCSIASYPGIENAAGAYELTPAQLKESLSKYDPVDRLEPLAKAKVPLFAIHGDIDVVVPLERNSGAVAARYKELGEKMELIVPKMQGHNMWAGFFECRELVDFVLKHARSDSK